VLHDVRSELISREVAQAEYGVKITDDLRIDEAETARLRGAATQPKMRSSARAITSP
jgi:hypothetical protein